MATQRTRPQRISFVAGAAIGLLGAAGLSEGLGNTTCLLNGLFEIPLGAMASALSAVISSTWQFLLPCLINHMKLLDCILHLTTCGWQIFLAFTGVG